jgi:hypothetical protein
MPRCKQPTQFLSKYESTHRSNAVPVTLHIRSAVFIRVWRCPISLSCA